MKCNLTDEAIRTIIGNAPEGAEYWTEGYDVQYRKLVLDCVFGWFPDDKKWVRAIDNDIAMERVDKGFWLRNLVEELVDRQSKPIPQTKELEWENGDKCVYMNSKDLHIVIGYDNEIKDAVWCKSLRGDLNLLEAKHLSKPESPEAKKEREAAWDLYRYNCSLISETERPIEANHWSELRDEIKDYWLAIVRKTGYRVEK